MGRKLRVDKYGISPVLGGMLALGMIITVSSTILAVWVPSEVNRRGEEYMRGVEESLRELGVMIEDLRVGENGSVDLKMCPDPVPVLPNPWKSGTLSVIPAENIELENLEKIIKSDLGRVRFDWGSQSLVYESGMIILAQDNMSFMKSPPGAVIVMQMDENNFEVHLNAVRIQGVEGSISGTGTSTVTVSVPEEPLTELDLDRENVTIWINSSYRDAWREYLTNKVDELKAIGINASLGEEENLLTLTIKGGGKNIRFWQKVTNIEVNSE